MTNTDFNAGAVSNADAGVVSNADAGAVSTRMMLASASALDMQACGAKNGMTDADIAAALSAYYARQNPS